MTANKGAAIAARLLRFAKEHGEDFSVVLNRFGMERMLYRLSTSPHAARFLLKGAMLLDLWYDEPNRPTRDADLLGYGPDDPDQLVATMREIAALEVDDGVVFDLDTIRAEAVREEDDYGGLRVRLRGRIDRAVCTLQIDVGFGDAVTPLPGTATLRPMLDELPAPTLRVYPVYTVLAEKYQAMVALGLANSRMKDFHDLRTIAGRTDLDGATLASAIAATFARRRTALPAELPVALTASFASDVGKASQWTAFLRKNKLPSAELADVVQCIADLMWPATQVASAGSAATALWRAQARKWT
jgi:hypothetical protein